MGAGNYTFRVAPASVELHKLRLPSIEATYYAFGMDEQEYKKRTGERLRAAREAIGITQAQAAEYLGQVGGEECPPSRISNWEQGTRLIKPVALQTLSKLYGVSPSAIYGFDDAAIGADERALLDKYRSTDERGKRAIHGVADTQPAYAMTDLNKRAS